MKITVKTLMCETYEFTLDANANIRELRTKTGSAMNGGGGAITMELIQYSCCAG